MTSSLFWWLINLQITLGAFDVIYHHELTERLAWRATASRELRLHATRNWLYAVLFLALGWTWPTGLLALAAILVLAIEVAITLWDFVEEDQSRRLPGSERILHTLLAINYGAILALLVPELIAAAELPTGLVLVLHGWQSLLVTLAAGGVVLFGLRDWAMSRRVAAFARAPAAGLVAALPPRQRILVTGGTGLIGSRLVEALAAAGHDVIAHARSAEGASRLARPVALVTALREIPADTPVDAIVNLAGAPIASWPWTLSNRLRILRSRLRTTRDIVRLVERLEHRPRVLVSGSAIGFYGNRGEETLDERSANGLGFAARLCAAWEREARRAEALGVRVVAVRTGIVLDRDGGMLARLLPVFDLGLGGRVGSGRQWLSWIARDDLVRLIAFAIGRQDISGPLNATAPEPVRNERLSGALADALSRPAVLPLPALPLRIALGEMGEEMLLASQRVLPAKALAAGFVFHHATIVQALGEAVGASPLARQNHPRRWTRTGISTNSTSSSR
jgi:hypothetical protein